MSSGAPRGSSPGGGALFAAIGVFVLIGVPLVYVVWEGVNHLLTGNLGAVRPGPVLAAVIGLVVVLYVLTRVLRRWSDGARHHIHPGPARRLNGRPRERSAATRRPGG